MDAGRVEHYFYSPIRVDDFEVHINYSGDGYLFVESITIDETNAWKNILLFHVGLFLLLLDGFILFYRRIPPNLRRRVRVTGVAFAGIALFASVPLLSFFLLQGDDLMFHLNRIEAIRESLLLGNFPNRVSTLWNDGYGYASAVLYGEAFLYVPALFRLLGFSVQGAYKLYVFLVNLATVLVAYFCFQKVFHHHRAALIGSAAYALFPYRLACIYLRAAVGEYTAMTFFPLIFCGLMSIYWEDTEDADYKKSCIPLIIGLTGIVQSHVISGVIVAGFGGLFCLIFLKRTFSRKRFLQLIRSAVWVVFLNLWFLLPFVDYMHLGYANRPTENNAMGRMPSQGAFLSQMLTVFQTGCARCYTTIEGVGNINERNYALGAFALVPAVYLLYRLYQGKARSRIGKIGDFALTFAVLAGFMCTVWFPWGGFQQMNGVFHLIIKNIQFPWRFLGICCFFLAVVTVSMFSMLEEEKNRPLYHMAVVLMSVFVILSADYYMYSYTQEGTPQRFDDEVKLDSMAVSAGEYLLENTPDNFSAQTTSVPGMGVEVFEERNTGDGHEVRCRNTGTEDSWADLPLLPYRGYVCRDQETGETFEVLLSVPGRLRVMIPGGYEGTLCARFQEPWYWRMAEAVSLFAMGGAIYILIRNRKQFGPVLPAAWQ